MKWKTTTLFLVICFVAVGFGCRTFQPAPKPQSGGSMIAEIPTMPMPAPPTLTETKPLPSVKLSMTAPQNPAAASSSTWTREGSGSNLKETLKVDFAPVQADHARKAWGSLAESTAFMNSVRWLPLLGLLPLGLLVFSLTPYGKVLALSKEGRVALVGASLFLFVAPAISKSIVDNATLLIVLTIAGVAGYVLWERKTAYKLEAVKRGAI